MHESGCGTFRTCRDFQIESAFGDKAEVGSRSRQGLLLAQSSPSTSAECQQCKRLAATPLRRATSVTLAPGISVSSTIRRLVILRPALPPLQPAQHPDPHRLTILKLDLRSHASRNTWRRTRRRSSDAYSTSAVTAVVFAAAWVRA